MTQVDVYPMTKAATARVFAGQSTAVCELYSIALAASPSPIKATTSWTRIFADASLKPGAPSEIDPEEPADNFGFSDGMRCPIVPSILSAEPQVRALMYLDWLHDRMLELANVRSWDDEPLVAAYEACRAVNCELRLQSKPKASPDRQCTAQLQMTRDLDGDAIVRLSIYRRGTEELIGQTMAHGPCSADDFRKMSRQLRWTSTTSVVADDDYRTHRVAGLHFLEAIIGTERQVPMIRPDWKEVNDRLSGRGVN